MRLRGPRLWLAAAFMLIFAMLPSLASSEPLPVEAVDEGIYFHHWANAQQTVLAGQAVKFANPYTSVPHGLKFTGGTAGATPSCSGVPAAAGEATGATNWHGECTFTTPGTYTFICTVHPTEMQGTITVTNGEPTTTTDAATSVGEHEATIRGTVNPNGKSTKYRFKWGTTASYGQETAAQSAGEGIAAVPVSFSLSGLAPSTSYHYRLVAENEKGPAEGVDRTFTTSAPPGPPTASTGQATSVGETQATLQGTVNPNGEATKYFFRWGTTTGYGQTTGPSSAGEDHVSHSVATLIEGLVPGTTYHFQIVAENNSGSSPGADREFTTSLQPSSPKTSTATTATQSVAVALAPPLSQPKLVEPPAAGGSLVDGSVKLIARLHRSALRGSIGVSFFGAGSRLQVSVLAKGSVLTRRGGSRQVIVGHLLRTSVPAGTVPFAISLNASAKRALSQRHRLVLSVRIVLTPPHGTAVSVTRSVVLRA